MSTSELAVLDPSMQLVTEAAVGTQPRKRTVQIGTALLTGAAVMYFGGLFGAYVSTRNQHLTLRWRAANFHAQSDHPGGGPAHPVTDSLAPGARTLG